jgi:hypothetical protein
MTDVVGIHGIAQQQGGPNQLLEKWRPALHDGIRIFLGRPDAPKPSLDIAFYGDLFLKAAGTKGPAVLEDLDDDTLHFLLDLQDEVVEDTTTSDRQEAKKGLKELPGPLTKLAGWLDHRFGLAGKILFFGDLIQVRQYQRDEQLASTVRERAIQTLSTSPRVLIGHSLGSIVAYEVLCMLPDHGVDTLITLGSPLGLRSIRTALRPSAQDRLPKLPPGIARWVNVYDPSDAVACAGGVRPYWSDVRDHTVDNGNEPHAITRYLGKHATGEAVVAGLGTP